MKNQADILAHLVVAVTIVLDPTGLRHSVPVSKEVLHNSEMVLKATISPVTYPYPFNPVPLPWET